MIRVIVFLFLSISFTFAISENNFIDKSKCDKIIDKQFYNICYSYKYKGALGGWVKLDGKLVNKGDIKKRPRFYSESNLPMKYRSKNKDYTGTGKDWNRGHFIVADADFDYDDKVLNKAYTMANIIPQSAKVNQKTWLKVEKYGRSLASKLGYINSISIADYSKSTKTIKNNVYIPTDLYRIYYNNEANFLKCFHYENRLDVDYKNDKLKDHQIDCMKIRIK